MTAVLRHSSVLISQLPSDFFAAADRAAPALGRRVVGSFTFAIAFVLIVVGTDAVSYVHPFHRVVFCCASRFHAIAFLKRACMSSVNMRRPSSISCK
jgi:hypothetical protein